MATVVVAGTAGAGDAPYGHERVGGNPTCAQQGLDNGFKIDAVGDADLPEDGTYDSGDAAAHEHIDTEGDADGFEVEIDSFIGEGRSGDAKLDSFHTNQPVSVVIVKAGPGADIYTFDPAVTDGHDLPADRDSISHITFCWDGEIPDDGTPPTTAPDDGDDEDTPPTTGPDDGDDEDTPPTTEPADDGECDESGDEAEGNECDESDGDAGDEDDEDEGEEDVESVETPAAAETAVNGTPNLTG